MLLERGIPVAKSGKKLKVSYFPYPVSKNLHFHLFQLPFGFGKFKFFPKLPKAFRRFRVRSCGNFHRSHNSVRQTFPIDFLPRFGVADFARFQKFVAALFEYLSDDDIAHATIQISLKYFRVQIAVGIADFISLAQSQDFSVARGKFGSQLFIRDFASPVFQNAVCNCIHALAAMTHIFAFVADFAFVGDFPVKLFYKPFERKRIRRIGL